ncbi:CPBP family intramembrane glutamic endopeptidase [Mariniflexile aquimaris]|uniref:CPBP family intramembrane glutamic endopeptidase n=1 Tax=Mariniflexile aquimaris TaxID=881009 RepID=A0ABW3BNZ4_9FLAO
MRGWQRILLLIFPYFLVVGIFQLVGVLIAGVDYSNVEAVKTSQQHVIVAFFTFFGTFALLWFFMKYVDEEKFVNLGFQIKNRIKDINLGVILGLVIMGAGLLILISLNQVQFIKFNVSVIDITLAILVYIFVAFTEEALFRGYILRNFMGSFNNYVAIIASSVLFAVAHGFNPNMDWFSYLNLFLAGILLGATYIYTKNLWFPIALHFSWNFFQTLFGFNVSGQQFYSLIEFKITDKNMLNGGDFGFEGSIFSIAAQVLLIASVFVYYERIKPKKIQI